MRLPSSSPLRELKYALWFPAYLPAYALAEHLVTTRYWATELPVDNCIPFSQYALIPYSLWYPLLIGLGLYLLFRDSASFRRYMCYLALTFFLSVAIWLLVPNGQDLRPQIEGGDFLSQVVVQLYRIDTNTNVFPSVHVVGAVGAALAAWNCPRLRRRPAVCWSIVVLAAAICLSTLFLKQHTVLDVAGGLVLSTLVAVPLYRRSPASVPKRAAPMSRRRNVSKTSPDAN